MSDNNFKTFFDALKNLDIFKELEATRRNENDTNDHDLQGNRWIDYPGNFSTNSFSLETGVSSFSTQLSIPGYRNSHGVLVSGSVAGAQHSSSESPEENPANSFLVPVAASRGDFRPTDDLQSNPSEHSSSQYNVGWSNRGKLPCKRPRNASFGANESTCRKKRNTRAKYFLPRKPNHPVSAWPPQMSIERGRNEAIAQTAEDYRELSSASAIFSPIDDISSINVHTHRTSMGSVAAAEAVSVAVPSGNKTQSSETGKNVCGIFKCEICAKTFGRKDHLRRHNNTHTGNKPFACSTCGKRFAQRSDLVSHDLVHSGEKPHECTECHKRFRQKQHLVAHWRTHTKEKPFTCEICQKGFAQKCNLDTHLRSHTGEKPYKCKSCGKSYKSKKSCIDHEKSYHDRK